jgi:WD40 repeat protein
MSGQILMFNVKEKEMKARFCTSSQLRAHDDTVSCLKLVGRNESRLMTASWDGSIKVWAMDAGKGGWAGTLGGVISSSSLLPEAEMVEHDSAVWSLEVDRRGDVAFSGAEDGKSFSL